ncbi:MAG: tetratricopeptide repeat protein [Deltaproteobacteria bacterium]|nr:tetratricopeptide repeat protein [Deltaproteobacteria bacterium]MBW2071185.1 tetratricopeptide repeat protein [Deltaproteobacteria bacterium]
MASSISFKSISEKKFFIFAVLLILVSTAIVYGNSLHNDFTNWDDTELVVKNVSIRSLDSKNIVKIFTPKKGKTYQPVRVLSYAIDYRLWNLNPLGYHISNTALHGLSAIILYLLLTAVLKRLRGEEYDGSNRMVALCTALLFVMHPVNVEAVAWISSRKYVLLALFYILAFYLYVEAEREKTSFSCYILSIVVYLLALLSSPFSVTLPAVLYLYDYCRHTDLNFFYILRKKFLYYLPYLFLSIVQTILLLNLVATGTGAAIKSHYHNNPLYTLLLMLWALYDYFRNMLLPFWLNNWYLENISYDFPVYKIIIAACILLSLIIYVTVRPKKWQRLPLFCFGWFFITLLPVTNIIPISTKIADRYLYLPGIGLFLWFSLILENFLYTHPAKRLRTFAVSTAAVILLTSLSYLSIERNKVWQNSVSLWSDSLSKTPNNRTAHLNLGQALGDEGRLEEAMAHYQEALRLYPNYAEAHNNLANALLQQGKLDQAIAHFNKALQLLPGFAEAHNNLAVALLQQGKIKQATEHYYAAVQLNPESAQAHNNLGVLLEHTGQLQQAITHYAKAIEIDPEYAEAYNNLGNVLSRKGNLGAAVAAYAKALALKPNYAKAHNNLGVALARQGKLEQAISHFQQALHLKPEFAQARKNLAIAREEIGKAHDAAQKNP